MKSTLSPALLAVSPRANAFRLSFFPSLCAIAMTAVVALFPARLDASSDSSSTEDSTPRLRLRIAVDQLKWNEIRGNPHYDDFYNSMSADVRNGLQATLVEKLAASGHFQVMEREATAMKQMKAEDQIDEEKRGVQAGAGGIDARQKRTPAQFIITPTVTGFQMTGDQGGGGGAFGVQLGRKKTTVTLAINIRIFDAQTSALIASATAEGKQENTKKKVEVNLGSLPLPPISALSRVLPDLRSSGANFASSSTESSPFAAVLQATLDDAVAKIVGKLANEPWSAVIAARDSSTGRVIFNAGADAGVSIGQTFDVMKAGGVVLDPDTGDVLTRGDESKVGRIRVVRVERNVAFCDVVEGETFEPKNVIRLAQR